MRRLFLATVLLTVSIACGRAPSPTPPAGGSPLPGPAASLTPRPLASATASATPLPPTETPTPTATPSPSPTPLPPLVLIISVDGLRPDALQQADAPHMLGLVRRGAASYEAQTVFPPVTLPAHASMLTGALPEAHGLTWNDYRPAAGTVEVPTIFSLARAAGLRTVMVVGKDKFAHLASPGAVDAYVLAANGDPDAAALAAAEAQAGFGVMFVHLPNLDYFGHLYGWMSERYLSEIASTDEAVGRLLAAVPEHTTVILTSDHGGHGLVHGANIPEDMTIPWIIAGPNVRGGHLILSPVATMDTAATAAYVLGLTLPPEAVGRPVLEAFAGTEAGPARDLLHGQWAEGAPQSPARSEMPAAVLDGLIYVPGGFGGESVFQAYDPAGGVWIDLPSLPAGRHHTMAAALDGKLYVFGGAAANGWQPTAATFAFDPARGAWEERASLPEARLAGAAVTLDGKAYLVGGVGPSAALLEYDPAADSWRRLAALHQPREHVAAAVLNGEIYALGGRWSVVGELASVEIYSPADDAWRPGPPLLRPHAGFSAAVLDGRILAGGGEMIFNGSETLTAFEVFDPATGAWAYGPDLPHPIHGVAAAAVDGRFFLLGGSARAGAVDNPGRVMIYTP